MTMLDNRRSELAVTIIIIILSGASVSFLILGSLDIVSYGTFRDIALIPTVIAIFAIGISARKKFQRLSNRLFVGMAAGAIATLALEVFRIPGYLFIGWIPMDDMIMLPGMLLTAKAETIMGVREIIMQSGMPMNFFIPTFDALVAGALWHFWNGATFGIVYSLFIGKGRWWYGLIWGFVVEIGMMLAPWLIMMKGPFGFQHMDGYNIFVMTLIAHLAFGAVLGILVQRWKKHDGSIFELKRITEVGVG
ncbi:hypothetical protein [Candidatus Nitrosotenuis uzonensis]|uniref:Uncharacterized protein n=1 Tax=Candidatus Nitrosotenuis uzonensis TaxID=1407055 RepID=A0A812EXX1_9ARCH|nr:hypothetical protein [Candidatus Nitrosotenuis uzonensis]CAE6500869.1 conserved membrane hypothetical protein [Candidatus Nitrosotenuis uzonensis]